MVLGSPDTHEGDDLLLDVFITGVVPKDRLTYRSIS